MVHLSKRHTVAVCCYCHVVVAASGSSFPGIVLRTEQMPCLLSASHQLSWIIASYHFPQSPNSRSQAESVRSLLVLTALEVACVPFSCAKSPHLCPPFSGHQARQVPGPLNFQNDSRWVLPWKFTPCLLLETGSHMQPPQPAAHQLLPGFQASLLKNSTSHLKNTARVELSRKAHSLGGGVTVQYCNLLNTFLFRIVMGPSSLGGPRHQPSQPYESSSPSARAAPPPPRNLPGVRKGEAVSAAHHVFHPGPTG